MTCESTLPYIDKIYFTSANGFDYSLSGETVIIDQSIFTRLNCFDEQSIFSEKQTYDTRGVYYLNELDIVYPDFNNSDGYSFESGCVFLMNANNEWYITGHYTPLVQNKFESNLNINENKQLLAFIGNSYDRVRKVSVSEGCNLNIVVSTTGTTTTGSTDGRFIVNTTGNKGTVYYSLDGINFTTSNSFTGLASSTYTVTVKDTGSLGCMTTESVFVGIDTNMITSFTLTVV